MVAKDQVEDEALYKEVLADFCRTHSEESLYRASALSGTLIEHRFGPDDIVALHFDGVQSIAQDDSLSHADRIRILNDAHQFLLEIMISYGAQYKEYLDLKLDDALRRAEQAELGQRERLEILAIIAHELGNPLTVALGNMQMAVRFLDAEDITQVRGLVSESREALERLAAVTGQLVTASKGDDLVVLHEPVDLRLVMRRMLSWASRLAEDKGVRLDFQQNPHPVWILGDEEALTSISSNLISNAVRYTPAGGNVRVSLAVGEGVATLEVTDTGIGMSEADSRRVFERFFRSDEAKQMEPRGIGMGLDIAHRLTEAHNGRIELTSTAGAGSTFRVVFPSMQIEDDDDE